MFSKILSFFFKPKPYKVQWNDAALEYEVVDSSTLEVQGSFPDKSTAKDYASMMNTFADYELAHEDLYDRSEDAEISDSADEES